MSHKPGYVSPNRPLNLRLESVERKDQFLEVARRRGEVAAEIARQLIDFWLGIPGATLPPGPWSDSEELHRAGGQATSRG